MFINEEKETIKGYLVDTAEFMMFLEEKAISDKIFSFMNGRIQYRIGI